MKEWVLDELPELSSHLHRLSSELKVKLNNYALKMNWPTKDFHQISDEIDHFLNAIPSDQLTEILPEILYLQAKFLFFSGNLTRLNELYLLVAAAIEDEAKGISYSVQIFYALSLAFQGYTKQAMDILEKIDLKKFENDLMLKIETMGIKLFVYSIKRDYKLVSKTYNEILSIIKQNEVSNEATNRISDLVITHALFWAKIRQAYSIRAMGEVRKAIDLLKECLNDLKSFPHRYFEIMVLTRLGHCYHNIGRLDTAIDYYDQAIDIGNEIQAWILLSILYNRVGMALMAKRDVNLAKDYFQKAFDEANKSDASWLTIGPLVNLAQWKLANGQINEAISDYETFAKIAEGVGDQQELCYAQLGLADLYEQIDDIPKSKYYFTKGVKLGLKLGILKVVRESRAEESNNDTNS